MEGVAEVRGNDLRGRRILDPETIASAVIDTAIRIHRRLGPGLVEKVYLRLLADELTREGFLVERQKRISFVLDGVCYDHGFRVDLLIEGALVVELKAEKAPAPIHYRQLLTYLRLMDLPLGLLINFGGLKLVDGVRRVVNNHRPQFS